MQRKKGRRNIYITFTTKIELKFNKIFVTNQGRKLAKISARPQGWLHKKITCPDQNWPALKINVIPPIFLYRFLIDFLCSKCLNGDKDLLNELHVHLMILSLKMSDYQIQQVP